MQFEKGWSLFYRIRVDLRLFGDLVCMCRNSVRNQVMYMKIGCYFERFKDLLCVVVCVLMIISLGDVLTNIYSLISCCLQKTESVCFLSTRVYCCVVRR